MARPKQLVKNLSGNLFFRRVMALCGIVFILGSVAYSSAQTIPPGAIVCCGGDSVFIPGSGVVPISSLPSGSAGSYTPSAINSVRTNVNIPENRQLANHIYEIAFAGINKALATKGKAAALELIQHQERNHDLMEFVEGLPEDRYIPAERVLAASVADARLYINGDRTLSVHAMSDARWKTVASKAQEDVDAKSGDTSEVAYIKNCYESPNCYGPNDEKAAKLLMSAYEIKQERLRAANEAAEAARQEQARIAAEEARIAQEKTAEEQRLAKLRDDADAARRFEVNHKLAQSEVAQYLGMGPIPPCNKPYEANFALQDTSGHMAIEVYPTHETIVINAMGDIKPTFDIKGRKKNSDYFMVGPSDGPLYVDVDLPQTLLGKNFDKKAVLVYKEGLNVGGQTYSLWGWIPIDAIQFCDQ